MHLETAFLALLVAHLLGDFVFQTKAMVRAKAASHLGPHLQHGLVHYLLGLALLGTVSPVAVASPRVLGLLGMLVAAHLLIDLGKAAAVARGGFQDGAGLFVLDQVLHLATVAAAAIALALPPGAAPLVERWQAVPLTPLLALCAVYLGVIFGGGYLIRYLLAPLREGVPAAPGEDPAQLERAGLWIGWLERFLVMTALLAGWPATAGLVVAAKSIFRFPALKDRPFAEYFLVGTLLSVSLALAGAVLLRRLLAVS